MLIAVQSHHKGIVMKEDRREKQLRASDLRDALINLKMSAVVVDVVVDSIYGPPLINLEDIKLKVDSHMKFFGNKVKITWIDHCYVTIEFFELKSSPRIAVHCPKGKFISQSYGWVDELTCFEKF